MRIVRRPPGKISYVIQIIQVRNTCIYISVLSDLDHDLFADGQSDVCELFPLNFVKCSYTTAVVVMIPGYILLRYPSFLQAVRECCPGFL